MKLKPSPKVIAFLTTAMMSFASLLFFSNSANAQVTIGSGTKPDDYSLLDLKETATGTATKALHLPRLSTTDRNTLTASELNATQGLAIYNTDTKCYEYWNQTKWISLCAGAAPISLDKNSVLVGSSMLFNAQSREEGTFTPTEDPIPSCSVIDQFTVTVISGSDFLHVNMVDSSTGKFDFLLDQNTTVNMRTAVVRITDNCTQEYKDYLVQQEGDASVCTGTAGTPIIAISGTTSNSAGKVCANGQGLMNVANVSSLTLPNGANDLVWSRNGIEVGRGQTWGNAQPGNYQVWLGGVGCQNKSAVAVLTYDPTPAPSPVMALDATENGVICDGSPITITAIPSLSYSNPPETIHWYKNYDDTGLTGASISGITNVGDLYTAVVVNPTTGCTSRVSNEVLTRPGTGTKPNLTSAGILINGATMSSNPSLCPNSTIRLEIANPDSSLTYEWEVNTSSIGAGTIVYYTIPADFSQLLLQCVVNGSGCTTSVSLDSNLPIVKPDKPVITSASSFVCASSTLQLSTAYVADVTYQWFKNGSPIAGATSSTYSTTNSGSFEVQASIGACESDRSDIKEIILAGAPTSVFFSVAPIKGTPSTTLPFQATGLNADTWIWSTDGLSSSADNGAVYQWTTIGEKTVTAIAKNACGQTPTSATVTIANLVMKQPTVTAIKASNCGSGAQYQVDLSTYALDDSDSAASLTGFNWTVKKGSTPISYTVTGEKGNTIQFNYSGADTYHVQAVAIGVGMDNSPISTDVTIAVNNYSTIDAKLYGYQIFDVAKTGSDLSQRQATVSSGTRSPYAIYTNNGASVNVTTPFNWNRRITGATYYWTVEDPDGLLSNLTEVNGNTGEYAYLEFGTAINSITNGQSKKLDLTCVVTQNGTCHYPNTYTITVQDKFACGTGGRTTKLKGTTTSYGQRTSQIQYDTYTFPTSGTDSTPRCWTIQDSAEGTNAGAPAACANGTFARQTDGGRGFHYRSDRADKTSACPSGWHLPTGRTNTSELGRLFALFQSNTAAGYEYKTMWFKNWTTQHGYDCTTNHQSWEIWGTSGTAADDHEMWINRTTNAVTYAGDNSHNSFSIRCMKTTY